MVEEGFVDVWRERHPNEPGYTWFNRRGRALDAARVDYILVSEDLVPRVRRLSLAVLRVFGPRYVIWPVIGFIGTVEGISKALMNISRVLPMVKDLDGFMNNLTGVTSALQIAFDSTLLALFLSAALMLVLTLVFRRSEDLLARVDRFVVEHVLPRFGTGSSPTLCGNRLIVTAGMDRESARNKRLVFASAPDWRPHALVRAPRRAFGAIHCAPDGRSLVAQSAAASNDPRAFATRWALWRVGLDGSLQRLTSPPPPNWATPPPERAAKPLEWHTTSVSPSCQISSSACC